MPNTRSGNVRDYADLFPVFVTADLPLEKINDVFTRSAEFEQTHSDSLPTGLVLVASLDDYDPTTRTPVPIIEKTFQPSKSPVLGASMAELVRIFEDKIKNEDCMSAPARFLFFVIDERTGRDGTLCGVQVSPVVGDSKDEKDGDIVERRGGEDTGPGVSTVQIRIDPEIATLEGMLVEIGEADLGEGYCNIKRDSTGMIVFKTDDYKRTVL